MPLMVAEWLSIYKVMPSYKGERKVLGVLFKFFGEEIFSSHPEINQVFILKYQIFYILLIYCSF